jgi:hypothetical protein
LDKAEVPVVIVIRSTNRSLSSELNMSVAKTSASSIRYFLMRMNQFTHSTLVMVSTRTAVVIRGSFSISLLIE